jgi:hypothetical protein
MYTSPRPPRKTKQTKNPRRQMTTLAHPAKIQTNRAARAAQKIPTSIKLLILKICNAEGVTLIVGLETTFLRTDLLLYVTDQYDRQ